MKIPSIGDKVLLVSPGTWCGHGCADVDAEFTITAAKESDVFGSGIGVQVSPAIQANHPSGALVWYDSAHFIPSTDVNKLRRALDSAAKMLFYIKRLTPAAVPGVAAGAHDAACKVLDVTEFES